MILTLGLTIYGSSVALSILPSRSPTAPTASPGLGPPHFAQPNAYGHPVYPYGLPYNAGTTPWVVENGHRGADDGGARALAPASSLQTSKSVS